MGRKINNDAFDRIKSLINQVTDAHPDGIIRTEAVEAVNKMLPKKMQISPATYSLIKKSGDVDEYYGIRAVYYENKKKRMREKKAEQEEPKMPVEESGTATIFYDPNELYLPREPFNAPDGTLSESVFETIIKNQETIIDLLRLISQTTIQLLAEWRGEYDEADKPETAPANNKEA